MKENKKYEEELPAVRMPIRLLIIIIVFMFLFLIILDNVSIPESCSNSISNNSKSLLDYIINNILKTN